MKVLVLGGTRFFGKLIVEGLLARGDEVAIFTRGRRAAEFARGVERLTGDRQDRESFRRALAGREFDAVVDNIAFTGADVRLAQEVLAGRAGHYVLCSSMAVYGAAGWKRYLVHREEGADLEATAGGEYSRGKREAEKALAEPGRGLPWTIIRPSVVEGPGDPEGGTWFWLQRLLDGRPVLCPEAVPPAAFNHLCAADAARLFVAAAGNPAARGRIYNAGGAEVLTLPDYLRALAELAGVEARLARAALEEIRRRPGLEKFAPPFAGQRVVIDISRAREELGYIPTPLAEWLGETVAWLKGGGAQGDSAGYERRPAEVEAARALGEKGESQR